MIYCSRCGLANRSGSHYCNGCGSSLDSLSPTQDLVPDWLRPAAGAVSPHDDLLPQWVERALSPDGKVIEGAYTELALPETFEPEELVFSDELDEEGPRESDLLLLDDIESVDDVEAVEPGMDGWLRPPRDDTAERFREAARYMMTPEDSGDE